MDNDANPSRDRADIGAPDPLGRASDDNSSSGRRVERVHLVHQSFGDYVSGLVHGLHDIGLSVVVTTISSGSARLTAPGLPDGVEHHQVSLPRFRHPASPVLAARAVRKILKVPADVVHWQAVGSPWVDLAFLAQMGGRPNVVTVHDMQPHPGDGTVLPLAFPAVHRLARRADELTVHAPHIKAQAEAIGVGGDRISVIAHGELATGYLPVDRLPLPLPLPLPSAGSTPAAERAAGPRPSVLFFGRAQGYKGLDVLLDAMRLANKTDHRVDLVVAGSGPAIDELLPEGRTLPPWCRVVRGHVDRNAVADLFATATMVALPYREASQSGVAALAAGFGRPVVASRVPGLADIVVDGETGVLVEPNRPQELADAIVTLASDPDLAERLSTGSHRHATGELSWPHIARQLHEVYDRAAGTTGPETEGDVNPQGAATAITSERTNMNTAAAADRIALIAVPGVEGGVDEAANYLMPEGPVGDHWRAVRLVTRGGRPAAAPLVLVGAVLQLIVRRIRGRVDVLHLNISHRGSTVRKLTLAAVARVIGVPYVLQIHTGSYAEFYRELPGPARAITRRLFVDSAHAFALGQVFVDLLVEEMGLAPEKVSVLRNGVPLKEPVAVTSGVADALPASTAPTPDALAPIDAPAPSDTPAPTDATAPTRLLFTGRIGERKGTFDLIEALGRITDLPWSIVIAGDGDVDRARTMATDLGVADRMEILGWQPREAVDRMVAEAEVFILPSNREALSISLLEAMAGELCCIATPVGAHGDVLADGQNSLLCQPGDIDGLEKALRLAMGDPELRRRLGAAARRTVIEECTIEANRNTLLSAYDRILR